MPIIVALFRGVYRERGVPPIFLKMYAATVLLSAFLLFQVQPMIARRILPAFGGSTAVWTTCMLFFQLLLLGGYLYADRLAQRMRGGVAHLIALAAAALVLPAMWLVDPSGWVPQSGDPTWAVLAVLAGTVGVPYFLLSATGPLVQAWYARQHEGSIPYRLFSLSNLGSFAGLLSYPLAIEPAMGGMAQLKAWAVGFVCFAVCCGTLAWRSRERAPLAPAGGSEAAGAAPSGQQLARWLALSAAASAMLLAVTNHITQNIAPVPFLWVLPLTLYLLTFVLCFGKTPGKRGWILHSLAVAALTAMAVTMVLVKPKDMLYLGVPVFLGGMFAVCMFCHGELAATKPHPAYLTRFYVMLSVGGALGAMLVAVIAPRALRGVFELSMTMAATAVLSAFVCRGRSWALGLASGIACLCTVVVSLSDVTAQADTTREMKRNFYGAVRITEEGKLRSFVHGRIIHGIQHLEPERRMEPTAYFSRISGIGRAIEAMRRPGLKVGIIGLGAGTLAAYGQPGEHYKFYEINPQVRDMAEKHFTFLGESKAKVEVLIGDGRLLLAAEPPQQYDIFVVDAFSGDSIPVHLITREAMELYRSHLKPDGLLAMHISNMHLKLDPVVARLAEELGRPARLVLNPNDEKNQIHSANWALIPMRDRTIELGEPMLSSGSRLWTDDYSNLVRILKTSRR